MANLQAVNGQSSKADEIAMLKKMAALAQPGSYLSSLFSEKMVGYMERQINDDMDCDLYGGYEYYMQQEGEARAMVQRAQLEEQTKVADEIRGLRAQIAQLTRDVELSKTQAAMNREDSDQNWERANKLEGEVSDLSAELLKAQEDNEGLGREVMRRKAQVLDLREKIEAMAR